MGLRIYGFVGFKFLYFPTSFLKKQEEPATKVKHHKEKRNIFLYSLLVTSKEESISEPVE